MFKTCSDPDFNWVHCLCDSATWVVKEPGKPIGFFYSRLFDDALSPSGLGFAVDAFRIDEDGTLDDFYSDILWDYGAAGRSLPPSTWSGRCLGASAPPLRPSRSAPSRRPHPRRQATCRRAIRARRPSNGDIPRRQPSQPPSSCSKVSRLIPIGGPAISALPVREALFYRLAARQSSRSGNTVVPP